MGTSVLYSIRDRIRSWLIRAPTGVLCIGSLAKEQYHQLGADELKLGVLPYCCDVDRYDGVSMESVREFADGQNLTGKTVFLYSGQLIPRKGVETLIHAFTRLGTEKQDVALLVLGDGPLRNELQSGIPDQLLERVHFLGHLPQAQLPVVFRAADVFVFPSRHDGWAVVINEACAARLPVIASEQTGAAHDLVEPGVSGFRHDAGDVNAFFESMMYLYDHPEVRTRMGDRSRELVEQYSPDRGAELFTKTVLRAVRPFSEETGCEVSTVGDEEMREDDVNVSCL